MADAFRLVKLTDPIQFTNVAGGLVPKGDYNNSTDYAVGDSVSYQGTSYVMFADAPAGTLPTNTTYWQVLASKGDASSTPGPAGQGVPTGGTAGQVLNKNSLTDYDTSWKTLGKSDVGLDNVDNTSDVNKPISTATKTYVDTQDATKVTGPASASDNLVPRFDGATGKLLKTSPLTIFDGGGMSTRATSNAFVEFVILSSDSTVQTRLGDAPTTTTLFGYNGYGYTGTTSNHPFVIRTNNANQLLVSPNGNVGIGTGSTEPTDKLRVNGSISSTSLANYNTSDQTTNYERYTQTWSSNQYNLITEAGGTGTIRDLSIGTTARRIVVHHVGSTALGFIELSNATSGANASNVVIGGASWSANSGINSMLLVNPTIAQSGTAGYNGIKINPTETSIGSGARMLIDAGVNNSTKFSVDTNGVATGANPITDFNLSTKQYVDTQIAGGHNLITNPSFEDTFAGGSGVNGATISQTSAQARTGQKSALITFATTTGDNGIRLMGTSTVLQANRIYTATAWVYLPSTGGPTTPSSVRLSVQGTGIIPSTGVTSSNIQSSVNTSLTDQWQQLQVAFQMPATTTGINVYVIATNTTAGQLIYVDDVAVQVGADSVVTTEGGQIWSATLRGSMDILDGANISAGSSTGTKIGTGTTQKLGFFGATPVAQQSATNDLGSAMANLGLRAAGATYSLTTNNNVAFTGGMRKGVGNITATVTLTTSSASMQKIVASTAAIDITPPATTTAGHLIEFLRTDATAQVVRLIGTFNGASNFTITGQYKYVKITTTTTSGVFDLWLSN